MVTNRILVIEDGALSRNRLLALAVCVAMTASAVMGATAFASDPPWKNPGPAVPNQHGPQKRGKGGKVRRW